MDTNNKERQRLLELSDFVRRAGFKEISDEMDFIIRGTQRRPYLRKKNPRHNRAWATPQVVRTVKAFLRSRVAHDNILKMVPEVPNIGRITDIKDGKYDYVLRRKSCPMPRASFTSPVQCASSSARF